MKILFFLGHPAHYHLFKNTISYLIENNKNVTILIKKKDILEDLLNKTGLNYVNVLPGGRRDGSMGILKGLVRKEFELYKYCRLNKPDLMVGTSAEIAHIGKILKVPSMVFSEDDVHVIKTFATITYSFADHIISPTVCNNGRWSTKTITYDGYHKLAYLHPNYFRADPKIVRKYTTISKPYFIIRFAKLTAHHDKGIKGIDDDISRELIKYLEKHGNVYITSERLLPADFEKYRLDINPLDIHHLMAYAKIFIGDSQSMTVESAMLGVPSIRFSSFTGKISVLEELEHKYGLTHGIRPEEPDLLFRTLEKFINDQYLNDKMQKRRSKMLNEKIDVTAFFRWLIANYPQSYTQIKKDPNYQVQF